VIFVKPKLIYAERKEVIHKKQKDDCAKRKELKTFNRISIMQMMEVIFNKVKLDYGRQEVISDNQKLIYADRKQLIPNK
jgi:hypothetical protein